MVRPSAAPTPTLSPFAEPSASVLADAVCVAVAEIAPVVVTSAPTPIVADVVTFERSMATSAVSATPPAAPFFAKPVEASVVVAESVRLLAPVSVALSASEAVVVSFRIVSETEAPTPTVLPVAPSSFGCALFVELAAEAALSETSPRVRVDRGVGGDRRRRVDRDDPDRDRAGDTDRPGRRARGRLGVEGARHVGAVHRLERRQRHAVGADRGVPDRRRVRDVAQVHGHRRADAERAGIGGGAVGLRGAVGVLRGRECQQAARRDRQAVGQRRRRGRGQHVHRDRSRDLDRRAAASPRSSPSASSRRPSRTSRSSSPCRSRSRAGCSTAGSCHRRCSCSCPSHRPRSPPSPPRSSRSRAPRT